LYGARPVIPLLLHFESMNGHCGRGGGIKQTDECKSAVSNPAFDRKLERSGLKRNQPARRQGFINAPMNLPMAHDASAVHGCRAPRCS
jgi:hypothetical protein